MKAPLDLAVTSSHDFTNNNSGVYMHCIILVFYPKDFSQKLLFFVECYSSIGKNICQSDLELKLFAFIYSSKNTVQMDHRFLEWME